MSKPLLALALSGGVDSAVAGLLLLRRGFALEGHHFLFQPGGEESPALTSAKEVARALGIPLVVQDLSGAFSKIRASLVSSYLHGRTPNPCVLCNRLVKTGVLLERALARGARGLATGHYVRVNREEGRLFKGAFLPRDQSYFLSWVPRERLRFLYCPLGEFSKEEVREMARREGWSWLLKRKESRELCFVSGTYRDILVSAGKGMGKPGEVIDLQGRVLGRHEGVGRFTVGQRKGLPPGDKPRYVISLDPGQARVVVGDKEDLACREALLAGLNLFRDVPEGGRLQGRVKVRSTSPGVPATLERLPSGRALVRFHEPEWALAPGQAAVLYEGEEVLASGILRKRLA